MWCPIFVKQAVRLEFNFFYMLAYITCMHFFFFGQKKEKITCEEIEEQTAVATIAWRIIQPQLQQKPDHCHRLLQEKQHFLEQHGDENNPSMAKTDRSAFNTSVEEIPSLQINAA